jgi:hypothetical protein
MLINDIHNFVKFLKNQGQNIYHTPEQIDDAINRASLDLFRQEEKKFEEKQIVTDTLRPFKKLYEPTLDGSGTYALPSDYVRMTNLEGVVSDASLELPYEDAWEYCDTDLNTDEDTDPIDVDVEIDLVEDSAWVSRKRDKVAPYNEEYPIARLAGGNLGGNLEVLPTTVRPKMYYLKYPTKAVWAYTISGDGRSFIFDSGSSVDLDWPEISHSEIIEKTMTYLGVALEESTLVQYEQMQKRNNNE